MFLRPSVLSLAALAASVVAVSIPFGVVSCGGNGATPPGGDASADAHADAHADVALDTGNPFMIPDVVPMASCALVSSGLDPISFCTQKAALSQELQQAYSANLGVQASWDSTTGLPNVDDAGAPLHDFHDDLAFGEQITNFHLSASRYGDNELSPLLDDVLVPLAKVVEAELSPLPAEYTGETYTRLRAIASGLRLINENTEASKVDALADSYGRAIFTSFAQTLPTGNPDAGAGDGGDAGDAATGDAALNVGDNVVLGVRVSGGAVAYRPADVATGAYALIDMSIRHVADDPSSSVAWQSAAVRSLSHLLARGRDASGLFYGSLVTSSDPGHDALAALPGYPSDALLLDTQATIALALTRCQAAVNGVAGLSSAVTTFQYSATADVLMAQMSGLQGSTVNLWDGPVNANATTGFGYMEGWVPSTGTLLTNKPTRGNALVYAALHHVEGDLSTAGIVTWQVKFLGAALTQTTPPNSSLLSVVPLQTAYLAAASKDFKLASLGPPDAGADAGIVFGANSYTAKATNATCEAMNEFWYGFTH
jgi:hypothetical protein